MDKELIPRKIHWCWLSDDPLPRLVRDCIKSWQRIMPDYEIIRWDTKRFDIHSVQFVEQAYNARKWAFAADYIRLFALYAEGGIYLDSDVRVFRKFDKFLRYSAFSGTEKWRDAQNKYTGCGIQAAIIGAEKGNPWIKDCMAYYLSRDFIVTNGKIQPVDVSPAVLAHYADIGYGFKYDIFSTKAQLLKSNIAIFPPSVFASLWSEANLSTYAMHLGEQAWIDEAVAKRATESRAGKLYRQLCSSNRLWAMIHYWRKHCLYLLSHK
ncbi:MAG: hypothetical protein LBD21_04475 [Tannerellaceae bacterium]|nr:hypothetical protein [Tannerellaceae bacterium]